MDPNSRKQVIFNIKNVAELPATKLSAAGTIITLGEKGRVQESIQVTRVPTLAKD